MIVILDLNIGNIISVKRMIMKLGYDNIIISNSKEDILNANRLILPGVGHFDAGMHAIEQFKLFNTIMKVANDKRTPILGICLGAQLLLSSSEEGLKSGLGIVPGRCKKFDERKIGRRKIPNMGWMDIQISKKSYIFENLDFDPRFYFVHSYHFILDNKEDMLCSADYGYQFCAAFQRNNVIGLQFHPEKSHKYGMRIMKNF